MEAGRSTDQERENDRSSWWSASVVVACIVEGVCLVSEWRNLVLFKAADWDSAKLRAIEIADRYREEYRNGDGVLVRWVPKEVETLDGFEAEIVDGQEVFYYPRDLETPDIGVPLNVVYDLGASAFAQTGSGVYLRGEPTPTT